VGTTIGDNTQVYFMHLTQYIGQPLPGKKVVNPCNIKPC